MNKSFFIALALILALIKESVGLTQAQQDLILKSHNDIRRTTANGQTSRFQTAAKMYPLVWDNTLAQIAQGTANKCVFAHDPQDSAMRYCQAIGGNNCANAYNEFEWVTDPNNPNGKVGHHKYVLGQNAAVQYGSSSSGGQQSPQVSSTNWDVQFGSNNEPQQVSWGTSGNDFGNNGGATSWSWSSSSNGRRLLQADQDTSAIQGGLNGWINEDNTDNMYSMDHFTQMVADKTRRVGCGYKDCGSNGRLLFCDYYPPGNMKNEPAYTTGNTASLCPNGSTNGLCN